MDTGKKNKTGRIIQLARFFAQMAALTLTVIGSYAVIRGMGIPKWAFVAIVVLAGMFFCGWMCPFGTIQEWLRHVGKNVTGYTLKIPPGIDRYLVFSRYVLFALVLLWSFDVYEPRNAFSGYFSGRIAEPAAYGMMGALLFLSLFTDRPFCKYLCGFGAQYGILSILRIVTVKRDKNRCVGCKQCDQSCLMGIKVSATASVRHPNCINCFKCVSACPVSDTLAIGLALPGAPAHHEPVA